MKIAIVDDDNNWRERVKAEVQQCDRYREFEIDLFENGQSYLDSSEQYDLSFIDIEMSGIDGFDTIARARENNDEGLYVILTTHAEMSRRGYLVNAFRYIDKAHLEEIKEAITSANIVLGRNELITVNVINDKPRELVLKNIIYIETEKHYIVVHTKQGPIKCNNNMTELENMLPPGWFCRCHNVFIVNLDEIDHFHEKNEKIVYLSNGHNIDVAWRRLSDFKKLYLNRQYECANK